MMDQKIAGKILDRIAELYRGNEQRTMEYLDKAQSPGAERQRQFEKKRMEAGMRPVKAWLSDDAIASLKQIYPGPRGGIDWSGVIAAALDKAGHQDRGTP